MDYSETIEERDGYRVRLVIEEGADKPYDEGQAPLLRMERIGSWWHATHIQVAGRPTGSDDRVEEAAQRWGGSDLRNLEKYLRAFCGVTRVEVYRNSDWTYVAYDSAAWRKHVGLVMPTDPRESLHMLDEWEAYCEGEVYCYVVEKRVRWRAVNPVTDDPDYAGYPDMTTWETVDSCGGYYGDTAYLRESALESLMTLLRADGKPYDNGNGPVPVRDENMKVSQRWTTDGSYDLDSALRDGMTDEEYITATGSPSVNLGETVNLYRTVEHDGGTIHAIDITDARQGQPWRSTPVCGAATGPSSDEAGEMSFGYDLDDLTCTDCTAILSP